MRDLRSHFEAWRRSIYKQVGGLAARWALTTDAELAKQG